MESSMGLSDSLIVRLNPEPEPEQPPADQPAPIPPRPDGGDDAGTWVDYVVALGADRGVVDQLSIDELVFLADRFGG